MGSGDAGVHAERKRAIQEEHPEVAKLVGPDSRTQYFAYSLFLVQVFLAYIVRDSFIGACVLGVTISPYVDFAVLTLVHEVSHNLVFKSRAANRLLGILCNTVFIAPVSEVFRQHHNMHHLHLGDVHKDVDVPGKKEMRFVGNSVVRKTAWLVLSVFVLPIRSMLKLPVFWSLMMVINWAACISFGLFVLLNSKPAFLYMILGTVLSQSMHPANARQVQRHINVYKEKEYTEQSMDTPIHLRKLNTFSYYGVQNIFTLNVGYHVEHHDFANIAWTRLPELRKMAGDKWYPDNGAYHTRGVSEIIAFILNPKISLADYAGRVRAE